MYDFLYSIFWGDQKQRGALIGTFIKATVNISFNFPNLKLKILITLVLQRRRKLLTLFKACALCFQYLASNFCIPKVRKEFHI